MGTWGAEIFEDDVAADVRDDFEDALRAGAVGVEATQRVLSTWQHALDDPDDGPVIIFALAAIQLEHHLLQPTIRDQALSLIDAGRDLDRWATADAATLDQRRAVLAHLRARLISEPLVGSEPDQP